MRKTLLYLGMMAIFLAVSVSVMAQEPAHRSAAVNPEPAVPANINVRQYVDKGLNIVENATLLDAASLEKSQQAYSKKARVPSKAAPVSIADMEGTYVQTYKALTSSLNDGGVGVTVTQVAGTDSIAISDFYSAGANVVIKAKVDIANKTITIPCQYFATHSTYGEMSLAFCTSTGAPDRTKELTGVINDDGSFTIDSWWGIYVDEGDKKDAFINVSYNTLFEKANGTMTQKRLDSSTSPASYVETSYSVVVKQTSDNIVSVKNFANYGQTVEFYLNRDETATINSQLARKDATNGDWYTYAITYGEKDGAMALQSYSENITTAKATEFNTLIWNDWTLLSGTNSGQRYYAGILTEGKVVADFDITYPKLSVSEFEGEGTEASPYLIKTKDDLILLSDKVKAVSEFTCTTPPSASTYARIYLGKYFRLENDIDMAGYRFTPIGDDWKHIFAGTFDGNGHKITGLDLQTTGTYGYAGLFGRADTLSVIKNLTLVSPKITATASTGAIAGWSLGTIDNCHVTGAVINSSGAGAGSVAGIARIVTNSSAVDCKVTGTYGYTAALAGEIDELIENSYATGAKVVTAAVAEGYPSGGLVGSLYKSSARNCYFKGSVDGTSLRSSNQVIGGIAGTCYLGSIDQCFAVGTVSGYDTKAVTGGVVGTLYGSLTNSFAVGRVDDLSSRSTGGIVGYVRKYTDNSGATTQSVVKNCYTATSMTAECYQYDSENEVRESLGSIEEGATPTIENVYFDNQLTDFTSTKYGVSTAFLTSASGPAGFDASVWNFAEGQYPSLKAFAETEAAKFASSAMIMGTSSKLNIVVSDVKLNALGETKYMLYKDKQLSTQGNFSTVADGYLKLGNDFGTDTLFVINGNDSYYAFVKVAPIPFEGEGTEANPFLLKTKQDMITLSNVTTSIKQLFPGFYFKMANDIDLESDPDFVGICTDENDAHNKFEGTFDGDGHTLHNMYINSVVWKVKPEDAPDGMGTPETGDSKSWKALFGRLASTGVVKNLTMAADSKIFGWGTAAAFVGSNEGLIENCKNYADVVGYSCWIGAFAGQNQSSGIIKNCYNAGDITSGYMNAGGIAGTNYGTIENCANAGDIAVKSISNFQKPGTTKLNSAGGIAGGSGGGVFKNVLNVGTVYAAYSKAGGISATLTKSTSTTGAGKNDVTFAINYGMVYDGEPSLIGAIGGEGGSDGEIHDVYYDAQVVALEASGNAGAEGMKGVETSVLTSGTALENFDTNLWQFDNGMYPVMKQFAAEDLLAKARKAIIRMPAGVTAKDINADAELETADGQQWTLAKGDVFAVEGGTLKAPASVDVVVEDTLVVTYGDYVKPIKIGRLPKMPLAGEGTEESPYLITSVEDWNALANFVAKTANTLEGIFLKVTTDIDFTDKAMSQIANDGATFFQGTLDGDGKRISGIDITNTATYQGVFGIIGEYGTVKNLTLSGKLTSAFANAGGFAGKLHGKLINCVNEINVTSTKASVAGFAGYAYTGAELTDCVNKGKISGSSTNIAGIAAGNEAGVVYTRCGNEGTVENTGTGSYTAGIVGTAYPATFVDCYNKGEIVISKSASVSNVAGIVAYANGKKDVTPDFVFKNCYNESDITAYGVLAGIVGLTSSTAGYTILHIDGCYNTGDIVSVATAAKTGNPIAGIAALYSAGSEFTGCWNSGTIMQQKHVYAAGITGYYKSAPTAALPVTVSKCYNTGNIVASGNQGGGVIAYCNNFVTVDSCYNTGVIEGGFGLGGIAACLTGTSSIISNSWNSGDVTTTTNRAGGIVGYNSTAATITNCFNVGNVATTSTVQDTKTTSGYGIGGIAGTSSSAISYCYNAGTLTGASQVGGIVGQTGKDKTSLSYCYNIGKLVAEADTCGALVGVATENNGKVWTDKNKVENCYFVTDFGTYTNNKVGTALTVAELAAFDMGEAWVSQDDYSFPILKSLAGEDAAKANSAAVVLAEGDAYTKVTKDFFVGKPDGVVWTASLEGFTTNGNNAGFSSVSENQNVVLTATAGYFTKEWTLTLDSYTSGIGAAVASGKTVISEAYYTVDGRFVAKPQAKDGNVYIVKVTYNDGTSATLKKVNK